jgi:5'-3' exonuclease
MGVPSFFAWLLRKFKNKILSKSLPGGAKPNYLYLDANCLFHPECAKIKDFYLIETDTDELETKMFKRIGNYLNYIEYFVNPSEMIYTSVDGVAPLAKMCQQRKRRFKSIDETNVKNELKIKHKIPFSTLWNNTVITPGTEFMERLHKFMIQYYEGKKSHTTKKYVYSSYHTVGEGEHKILQHIKSSNDDTKKDNIIIIYGLDADLIFLALASGKSNIYLLRETIHLGQFGSSKKDEQELYDPIKDVAQDLMYVSIDETKKAFNEQLWNMVRSRPDIKMNLPETTNFSNDFIFICFLLGNDFLPHFPSIDIHSGGLDEIIHSYIECVTTTNQMLTNISVEGKITINHIVFNLLVESIGKKEERYFKNTLPKTIDQHYNKRCMARDKYSEDLWNLENMMIFKVDDPVGLGYDEEEDWKFRYYEHYFHVSEHQELFIDNLVKLYLEGIMWVSRYYFEECPDWRHQYPYDHAPFISDIAKYMKKTKININDIKFNNKGPVPMMVQLTSVLPPVCHKLLPKSYQSLVNDNDSPIIDLYPIKTELDMLYKFQYWQCIPKIPYLNIERVIDVCQKKKLTKEESVRQTIMKDFVY